MKRIKIAIAKAFGWLITRRGLRWLIPPVLKTIMLYRRWKLARATQRGLIRPKTKIYRVLTITPGRHRAWVESSSGIIKKPLVSIPGHMLEDTSYDRKEYLHFMQTKRI